VPPAALDRRSVSRLFLDALGLSAWKEFESMRWSLRVDPSSGNLHPTEGYLLCGAVEGLSTVPMLAHYAPREHALEVRAEIPAASWDRLASGFPPGTIFIGISSIHWREAWKYGERAFRYCQHDCGHVIACLAVAAAGLGWSVELVDDFGHDELVRWLGLAASRGPELEEPECLLAVTPLGAPRPGDEVVVVGPPALALAGEPNELSPDHVEWGAIELAAIATRKARTQSVYAAERQVPEASPLAADDGLLLRRIFHSRRSAVSFDGRTEIGAEAFFRMLASTSRGPARRLPWAPRVHLGLFVHRVRGLEPGLYAWVRDPEGLPLLRAAMQKPFAWARPDGAPENFFRLASGDVRAVARSVSCHQEIGSDGCFALAMLAEFEPSLRLHGAWFYRRLFWECGAVGQALYLEAEAVGIRATGIGCYFDEPAHQVFGLDSGRFRSLYHFCAGGPVDDPRLGTWPAYPPRDRDP
jgi:SagB-type dehydrogenase family enzyme